MAKSSNVFKEPAEFNDQDPTAIIRASLDIKTHEWIARRQKEAEEFAFSPDEVLGEWPGEIPEKGSISLHKDVLSGEIKPEVYLGLARIEKPWHLPAVLEYGAWNECPQPEVHCAFHREWLERFGAEITGMSGDVVECTVKNPPINRKEATILAWGAILVLRRYCRTRLWIGLETCGHAPEFTGTGIFGGIDRWPSACDWQTNPGVKYSSSLLRREGP